ncbi:zinc ABC transporter substrate-binding protein [Stutzerimonas stutzeri]|uniref:High-affinity zinc uptake system protein ZnuA n=1 Tax=Stutzerimonas stutzeri TaxID=316 RepID=A0A2S4AKT0_STUST|nr:zinc ABC transporter substrate-binding protein ZnuA [Stutzerimonas stutzeri]MCQ4264665.1 zinc ABC transporter substrate-binding protein ZnuA [Stutzerimonas stutzeri]POH81587.1 zinc ABC transporter substrate-binding protein [Stutzerimonas stutzeri]
MNRLCSVPLLAALLAGAASAQAEVRVLTSIKPLQLIAAAVQDGVGEPDVLLPASASAHHYSLRPSDVRRIRDAELFYWIGPDLESFLPRALSAREGATVAVQDLPKLTLRRFGDAHTHAEDEHHDHDDHAGHAHAEHDHDEHEHHAEHSETAHTDEHDHDHRPGSLDAHLWLLPANALVIAERMAADLAAADPANAQQYHANTAIFAQRIEAVDAHLKQRFAGVQNKPFFVFHEAYDYFEAAYGLRHAGVFTAGGEAQPGARHVAAMRERLQQAGPSCVFSEPPARPRLAETLTAGLPVKMAELDVLGVGLPTDAKGYERLLERLGDTLAGCLESL